MKKLILLSISVLAMGSFAKAEEVYKIKVDRTYRDRSSNEDMKRRIWELERAVWQLQQRVFELEADKKNGTVIAAPVPETPDAWACTITAMGDQYVGTGGSKAVATARAVEKCTAARKDSFFCKDAKCEK